MKLLVVAVGKMRDRGLAEACEEYLRRARRHLAVEEVTAADDRQLLRRIPADAEAIALEPGGEPWTTAAFTAFIGDRMLHGPRSVAFLVGGAAGLPREAVARAGRRVSLSALTLPHRLARVILCEQIYRALTILKGEPYGR